MDRYNPASQYPYNSGYGGGYPPPPPNHPYPHDPYAPQHYPNNPYGPRNPAHPPPYSQAGAQPYPYNPYPPRPAPYPPHDIYSQPHYQDSGHFYPPPSQSNTYLPPPPRSSFSSTHGNDASSQLSAYPPIDHLIADMSLSDNPGSIPASPPAPSAPPAHHLFSSYSAKYDNHPNNITHPSVPSSLVGSFSNRINPQAVPGLIHSASLDVSQQIAQHGSLYSHNHNVQPDPYLQHTDSHSMQLVPYSPSKGSLKVLLLHGNLDIWIYDAKCLPNMDMFHRTLGDMLGNFSGNGGNKLDGIAHKITSDPYVSISVTGAVIGRTFVISNEENPVWTQHFNVPVAHSAAEVHFMVKDSDVVGSQVIGTVSIPVEQIFSGMVVKGTYPILNNTGRPCKQGAVLSLSIQYIPMENLSIYRHGVGPGPDYQGVPGTYFPLRRGGTVTLYQDAHVPDGLLPCPWLDTGLQYVHGKCWQDIFDAIKHARRLIYITGWSIWHEVKLVRHAGPVLAYSLGELLRSKSQEGVRVLLLVWDDPTSRSILGYKTDGLMQTHDEETRRFFKHSSVKVLLCPRIAGKRHSWIKQREVETIYTHHQKTVIVDADAGTNVRKIIAFVGGLDLCDGRYDTPEHSLFRTLNTVHKDDYHNPSFTGVSMKGHFFQRGNKMIIEAYTYSTDYAGSIVDRISTFGYARFLGGNLVTWGSKKQNIISRSSTKVEFRGKTDGCPREPWHDLHCKIDGPAAYDVLTNFEERWLKAAKPRGIKKLKTSYDDALLKIDRMDDIVGISDAPSLSEDNPEAWHVQIFRSIDSNSVKDFPKNPKDASSKNLVCGKNVLIDMSIHSAYVKAIRSAQHYIYIENQYFIGSSYNWNQHKDIGANNLIPMEIALKVANKIRAHERFAVYIVIPMWPEGVPTGAATQRILYWQNKTMQMMYDTIYKALVEVGLEDSYTPQDFLNFFCLGNRESSDGSQSTTNGSPHAPNTPQALCHRSRRFMIYVHSKGMIVDDEYLILGSANINQRSMEGARDTEIAMGGYQPNYTWAKKSAQPHGQIYGYRMSLWAEHLGGLEETYNRPETLECVRRVRIQAEMNWKQFASEQVMEMKGHLLKYPVDVDQRGKVKPLEGNELFPDLKGNICGSFTAIQENLTI
ncbi:hypothetical protein V2J09_011035 [Rumex salicifolius]